MRRFANLIIFLFIFFPLNAFSQGSDLINVSAEGIAVVIENNTAIARDNAINDALRKAVEQAVGTMIASETVVENYQALSDRIYSKTQGYIKNYHIISEQDAGELYRVTVQAVVAKGNLKEDLSAVGLLIVRKNMPRVMIMIAEQNIGMEYFHYWWGGASSRVDFTVTENILMKQLNEKGFNVIDHCVKNKNLELSNAYKIVYLNNSSIKKIGSLYDAEVVIYGKTLAKLAGVIKGTSMKSVQADISLRAVNIDNGQVIASSTAHGAAVHISEVTAGSEAIKNATEKISRELISQIISQWSSDVSSGSLIQMTISGITSYNNLVEFKKAVKKKIRGVKEIYQRKFGSQVAVVDIETVNSAQNLTDELSGIKFDGFTIEIIGITQNSINIKMTVEAGLRLPVDG